MQGRIDRLRVNMQNRGIQAFLIIKPENLRYISGFTGTSGYALITFTDAVFITDSRYTEQAKKQSPHMTIVERSAHFQDTIYDELKKRGIKQLAFEKDYVTYQMFEQLNQKLSGIQLTAELNLVEELRQIKEAKELEIIREAAKIADDAFTHILNHLRPGVRELDVALELEIFMRKLGATSVSFETIVASGVRSSLPHGVASDKVLEDGDFVKLDFGAYYKGYCSDLTRTVVLSPGPNALQREIYDVVLRAQLHALKHLRPGMTGREADALARDVIKEAGYGNRFGHSLGHSIGLAIHERPSLSAISDDVLAPGMVLTVEPGIYIPDFGGVRIEDDVLITESGIELLTHSPKELIVL